jgi:hypothetical protein
MYYLSCPELKHETTKPDKTYIVSPVSDSYLFKNDVEVCGISEFLKKVREQLYR